ncbi:MBOAT family O-acyltransferase [Paenibacillus koleovorans]|uniref:MBOAT family O-acyltransferase n=1 Tax=Paenibacillus koleovorans TaxID=121608 RepID=UPI000FD6E436|nr:MBOAT family O-acyltransferase [Paenibacillus koleovorans]
MLFHTPEFIGLLIVTLILFYWKPQSRIYLLTFANMLFYGVAGIGNLIIFITVTILCYICSKNMRGRFARLSLWTGVGLVVVNLIFFKYIVFLMRTIEDLIPIQLIGEDSFFLSIVLPIGISFYTFQVIAYMVDVYNRKAEPATTLLNFWVFISFFAHLVAGPIMRSNEFMPQIEKIKDIRFDSYKFKMGVGWFTIGLMKKIWLADYLSPYVNEFFARGSSLTGAEAWMASYMFAFQIFFDFAAYSEMAVGLGYMFGITLAVNFITPYLSTNATEFWRRWHITLSTWIRHYIYIPLGGSRKGPVRQYTNLFIAMTISGIWHGAAWTYVLWGMYHGLLLIVHKLYTMLKEKLGLQAIDNSKVYHIITIFVFFHLTCIGWVLFRVQGLRNAAHMLRKMFSPEVLQFNGVLFPYFYIVLFLFALHIGEYFLFKNASSLYRGWHTRFPAPVRAVLYTVIVVFLMIYLKGDQNTFIYFQF